MEFDIDTNLEIRISLEKMPNVPEEKIKEIIGTIVFRNTFWKCDKLTIINDGKNNLISYFRKGSETLMVLGAVWREADQKFTFHT